MTRSGNRTMVNRLLLAAYLGINLGLILYSVRFPLGDWALIEAVVRGWMSGADLYGSVDAIPFVWSPVAAMMWAGVLAIGFSAWVAAHVGSLWFLRDRLLILLAITSWPFWIDAAQGNTFTFSVVAGVAAVSGSRMGALAYLALFILMPRPVLAPLAVWLVWREPAVRVPAAILVLAHTAVVAWTGLLDDWITAAIAYGSTNQVGIGLARIWGGLGLLVGIPLAVWLTWQRRFGLAGLAMSGYLLPQYLLILLLEARQRESGRASKRGPEARPEGDDSPVARARHPVIIAPPHAPGLDPSERPEPTADP